MNRKQFIAGLAAVGATPATAILGSGPARADHFTDDATYTANEITQAGADFFGITTEAMAKAVEHVFGDLGQPDAYIKGDEGSGAFVVGLRYGSGWLIRKNAEPVEVFWRGPSVGFDFGGNASKCFTLIYNLREDRRLFQRYPRRRRQLLFRGGPGDQLPAQRRHHPGAHAHRRGIARGRQCPLSGLFRPQGLVSSLG